MIMLDATPSSHEPGAFSRLFDAHRASADRAFGVPRRLLGPDKSTVFVVFDSPFWFGGWLAGLAVQNGSFSNSDIADIAAMDAVEGRAGFARTRFERPVCERVGR